MLSNARNMVVGVAASKFENRAVLATSLETASAVCTKQEAPSYTRRIPSCYLSIYRVGRPKLAEMWRAARRGLSSAPSPCTYEGTPSQRTLLALKPDTVQRGLIGALLGRFEQRGFKVVGLKMLQPSRELAESHYEEHRGKAFYERACTFIASGPLVAAVLEGRGVIGATRAMIGSTEPLESTPGTIRFDYGAHWRRNLVHGSDSEAAAAREIPLWFRPEELCQWEHCASSWVYELPTARTRFDE